MKENKNGRDSFFKTGTVDRSDILLNSAIENFSIKNEFKKDVKGIDFKNIDIK
jgi:hypothetical protein